MNKKYRKVLAAILAATMVLGSGVVANAADGAKGSGDGKGSLDVVEKSDVFDVILPTTAGTQFDYILNPTDVIGQTDAAKYASSSFVEGQTMYFRNKPASGSTVATYSNTSDPITAYNLSTMNVEISVEAKVATPSGIEIAGGAHPGVAGSAATATATPSIYLGLKASGSNTSTPITTAGIEATSSIANAAGYYEVTYASDSKTYKKGLNATGSDAKTAGPDANCNGIFSTYSFMLTGTCNPDGKWEGLTEVPPTVSLVWSIEDTAGAATSGPGITFDNVDLITYTGLTSTQNYQASSITAGSDEFSLDKYDPHRTWVTDNYSEETGGALGVRIDDVWKNLIKERGAGKATVTLTLTDGTVITKEITVS